MTRVPHLDPGEAGAPLSVGMVPPTTPGAPSTDSGGAGRALHWVFFTVAVLFGLAFALVTPPNATPDELAHEVKIVRVAGGNLFGIDHGLSTPDIDAWYGIFLNDRMGSGSFGFRARDVEAVVSAPLDCRSSPRDTNDQVVSYSPLIYLLPAAALKLTCAVHGSFGLYLYGARIANLFASCALIAAGIAVSRAARWPIFSVSLLPSSVAQLASISADAMVIGLGMLFVAVAVGTALGEIGARRGMRSLTVLGILVSFSKPSLVWLSWLAFMAYPRLRRHGLPRWSILACFGLAPLLSQIALLKLGFGAAAAALPEGVDPRVNLTALEHDPLRFLAMVARVPAQFPFGTQWNLFESFVGKLGWLSVSLPVAGYALGAAGLLAAAGACRGPSISATLRLFMASVAVASVLVTALPLYLYATPSDAGAVFGLQGRYFLATATILLVAGSARLGGKASGLAALATVATSVALLTLSLVRFVEVYYG